MVEYFRSRGISKWKVFASSFLIFSGLFTTYVIFSPPGKGIYIGLVYAFVVGIFCAIAMIATLGLGEILMKRKKQGDVEKQD
jgi:peptidoglycan/LPS O-acetylase OafA/YrhL